MFMMLYLSPGPCFSVYKEKTKLFTSPAYEGVRKCDGEVVMELPTPLALSGDIMIQFFHKSKMVKRVRNLRAQMY